METSRVLTLAFGFFSLILTACAALPTGTSTDPNGSSTGSQGGTPTWAGTVSAIFSANCAACHGAGAPNQGNFDCSTEASVKARATDVASVVKNGMMPPPPASLNASDKATIAAWVADGMP